MDFSADIILKMSPLGWATFFFVSLFLISKFARLHWVADFFTNFKFQYGLAFMTLTTLGFINQNYELSSINAVFLAICVYEFLSLKHDKIYLNASNKKPLKVIQYNKFYRNKENLNKIEQWIENNSADVIVIQEADKELSEWAKKFEKTYPYKEHHPANHPYGIMILSTYEIKNYQKFDIPKSISRSRGYEFHILPEGFENPVQILTMHASNAMPKSSWKSRNNIILNVAERIRNKYADKKNIITLGDWNITPYSPFYRDMLKIANMNVAYEYHIPFPTWPNYPVFRWLRFLQIPIDHILFSNNLKAVKRHVGPALGSDHHLIQMDFIEK